MKNILYLLIPICLSACSSSNKNETVQAPTVVNEDSALLAEIKAAPDPEPKKITLFNDVSTCRQKLSSVGIGEMRRWFFNGYNWGSASNFYEFGTPGIGGNRNNLAFYLESPAEGRVETLKVKVNMPNMGEKREALAKYASTTEKTFKTFGIPMPAGLKSALLSGKEFRDDNAQRDIRNILEGGNYDSWKVQITSH